MSYILDSGVTSKLAAKPESIDRGVARVLVGIRPDHTGEDVLSFQVVLKDSVGLKKPSPKMGDRLLKIASELRRRAAELDVPLRASVRFVVESELRASQSPA